MSIDLAKAKAIFLLAAEQPAGGARQAFLAEACGDDAALRRHVEMLLAANDQAGSFLEKGALATDATVNQGALQCPGTTIGPYKLLEQIGGGGMGTVYMAEQTRPVQRKVAIKVIKAGMESGQVIARFDAERQALALMDHPNIAKVLDAGTTVAGRSYFVMELVKGVPITTWCDENHLPLRTRLELFTQVCHAVQHAHQKGIIHRDLKPSNVLVTLYDDRPVPKVIDFGVAKATGGRLTERTMFTGYGQIVGTVEYMSPEQARLNALDIDTRGDVYSLGVLLYELLTGTTPFDKKRLREAAFDEMLRMIREEEPPRPSTRLSTAEGRASIAANRGIEPEKLTGMVRGELDWIVMKALEKDRNRRYETANGFAMDIQRYLADEAVLACPPSAGYRLSKFVRRNKGPVLAASLLLLSLVAGIIGTTWGMIRATEAEADSLSQAKQKDDALIDKEAALEAARASEQTAKTNETIAKQAQEEADENLAHALAAVEQMLFRVGNDRLANVPQMETVRIELVADALTFYEKFLHKHNSSPLIQQRTAMVRIRLADLHRVLGKRTDAETHYRTGFAVLEELTAKSPLKPDTRSKLVNARRGFAQCLLELGKNAEAETQIRAGVELAEGLVQEFPDDVGYLTDLAVASNFLARLIVGDHPDEAEKILRRNLALTSDEFSLGRTHHQLGLLASRQGLHVKAEEEFRKALELQEALVRKNPNVAGMQAYLGNTLNQLADSVAANRRLNEGETIYAQAVAIWDKLAGDYPATEKYLDEQPLAYLKHAGILEQLNLTDEAANAYRKSMDVATKRATDSPGVPNFQQRAWSRCLHLGRFLLKAGYIEEAQHAFSEAEPFLDKLDIDAPARFSRWQDLCRIHTNLYSRLMLIGKEQEAHASLRKLIDILDRLEREFGGQDQYRGPLAHLSVSAGWLLHGTGQDLDGREKLARRAQAHVQAVAAQLPDDATLRSTLANSHQQLGIVLGCTARAKESEAELRQAASLFETLAEESPETADNRASLAHVRNALGWGLRAENMVAAEQEYRRALALFEALSNELPDNPWYQAHRAMLLETVATLQRDRGDLTGARTLLEQAIVYAQKACDLDSRSQYFRDRLQSTRAELERTLKAHEPEKNEIPK